MAHRPKRRVTLLFVALLLGTALGAFAPLQPALANHACSAWVESPHFSTGAGGVIVKSRFLCGSSVPFISQNTYLYLCSQTPQMSETWLQGNCTLKGQNNQSIQSPVTNTTYTRYAPPPPYAGAKGTGWWIGCVMWSDGGASTTNFSSAVWISAP